MTSRQIEAEIGQRLARLRLSQNMTQATLAANAGIGVRTLRRFEAGGPSTLDTYLRVALALGLKEPIPLSLPEWQTDHADHDSGQEVRRRRARPEQEETQLPTWNWGEDTYD